MANFIVKDSFQNAFSRLVTLFLEAGNRWWCDVKPARLQHHRYDGEPRRSIMPGFVSGVPQSGMGRQGTVETAHRLESAREQGEMHRLVRGDGEKIRNEFRAQLSAESPGGIEREVDRRKFDMGDCVP